MSQIRCIYTQEPPFPAADQHPDAVRYKVGALFVDALDGAPTQDEIEAVLGTDAADVVKSQISAIEAAQPITQRSIRELMLAIGQAFPAAQASVFYKKAAAQEVQVAALRDQLP